MAGTPIPFPFTAAPAPRPGDSQGDLVNVFAMKKGDAVEWRRVAGLRRLTARKAAPRVPRGQRAVGSYMVTAWTDAVEAVDPAGEIVPIVGELVGSLPVTIAANLRQIPEIAIVTDNDAYLASLDTMTVAPYPDPLGNLGSVNSVDYYSGYFIFTRGDGTIVASDLQNSEIPDLSFDTVSSAGGLLRAVNYGETVLLMGHGTIEVWADAATSPFPLRRQTVIPVGLMGQWAVAGGPLVWERGLLFVASDYTVRRMNGYSPEIVSNASVSADIYAARDIPSSLHAQVYAFDEQAIFSLSGLDWTWELNLTTGAWHRRASRGAEWWRGRSAAKYRDRWYVQDAWNDGLLEIATGHHDEDGERLIATAVSAALKDFPVSVRIPQVNLDFTVGVGVPDRPEAEYDPAVMVSWSHDGGASWSNPLARSLGKPGEFKRLVTLRNLGRSTHHGMMLRWQISDPVHITFRGAVAPTISPSRARQVALP